MAKINDYMAGRQDGLQLALTIVEKNGVDGLRDEIEFRNATKIHTLLDRKSLEIATRKIKEMTMDTFTILCVATLRDEFDFGTKRCQRFIDRMNLKAECLMDDIVGWQDFMPRLWIMSLTVIQMMRCMRSLQRLQMMRFWDQMHR